MTSQDKARERRTPKGHEEGMIEGSRRLARAILNTKKLYRKMTLEEQVHAVEYADGIRAVIRR